MTLRDHLWLAIEAWAGALVLAGAFLGGALVWRWLVDGFRAARRTPRRREW